MARKVRATPPPKKAPKNGPVEVMKVPEPAMEVVRELANGDMRRVQIIWSNLDGFGEVVVWNSPDAAAKRRRKASQS